MKGRALLALLLALVLLGLFILAVGWEEVYSATARASLTIYLAAYLGSVLMLAARSMVWRLLLARVDTRRPYWLVAGIFLTAMFAKYVTPYGQVASGVGVAAVVSRYYESTYEESLAAILSADFINYLPYYTLGGLGLGYVLFVDALPISLAPYIPIGVGAVIGMALVVATLWWGRETVTASLVGVGTRVRSRIERISPRAGSAVRLEHLKTRFDGFSATLTLLSRDRKTLLIALVWGHVGWLGLATTLYVSSLAVGVELPIGTLFLCLALSKLGFIIPTPGGVGGVEIALAAVLFLVTPMGAATGTAVAILYRFATYWFTVLVGGCVSIALTISDPTIE